METAPKIQMQTCKIRLYEKSFSLKSQVWSWAAHTFLMTQEKSRCPASASICSDHFYSLTNMAHAVLCSSPYLIMDTPKEIRRDEEEEEEESGGRGGGCVNSHEGIHRYRHIKQWDIHTHLHTHTVLRVRYSSGSLA